ncbi:MAG: amidohydrolase family protein [Candidatus Rokuibacteriota bacterium]
MSGERGDYDLVIRGGRVVDPSEGLNTVLDVAVREGRIAAIAPTILVPTGARLLDAAGCLVTPAIIDHHVHCFEHVTDMGVHPDQVGVDQGVGTVVEQGTVGAATFAAFRTFIVEPATTDVLCYLSVHVAGDPKGGQHDLHSPDTANVKRTVKTCRDYPEIVRGIKAHAELGLYSRWGTKPLALAKLAAMEADLPLAAHVGNLFKASRAGADSPDDALRDSLTLLDPGDILVHPYTNNPGGLLDDDGRVKPEVRDAYERGVLLDLAHGTHFNLDTARRAIDGGLKPHIISSDAHHEVHGELRVAWGTRHLSYTLWGAMAKMLALGLTVEEVILMTTTTPAAVLRQQGRRGSLRVGRPADVSLLRLHTGDWLLRDGRGHVIRAERCLLPHALVRRGVVHEIAADMAFDLVEARLSA